MQTSDRLSRSFYARSTLNVARELLGQRLVRIQHGVRTSGIILETEAYIGTEDLGCHARSGKTRRNQSMWGPPGQVYIYFTYGMHWMLNLVTEKQGFPAAVLIRSLIPVEGIEHMRERRGGKPDRILTDGPAKLCQALDIDGSLNEIDSTSGDAVIFVEQTCAMQKHEIRTGPRIGLNNVPEPWKSKPWRFFITNPEG